MNRAQRLDAVMDLMGSLGAVGVEQIVDRLKVSAATARRDLATLAAQHQLTRTRGGAVPRSVAYGLSLRYKTEQHRARTAIARTASELVPCGAVVGLSGGATSTAIVDALLSRADIMARTPRPSLTIVTNAIDVAMQLAMRPQIKTVVLGGVVEPRSCELVGTLVENLLESITIDVTFIGVNEIGPAIGATSDDVRKTAVHAQMASRSTRAVIAADSSKIDTRAYATIGGARLFSTIITDSGATVDQRQSLAESGYEVIVAA